MVPLLCAIFALLVWITPSTASSLKDIRIGEYDDFTRIVFEFDAPLSKHNPFIKSTGRVTLVFPQTEPALVRKIPVEHSDRIKEIQLWNRKTGLSTVVLFDFDNFRLESFELASPYRLAIDIYPLSAPISPSPSGSSTLDNAGDTINQSDSGVDETESQTPVADQTQELSEHSPSSASTENKAPTLPLSSPSENKKMTVVSKSKPLVNEEKSVVKTVTQNTPSSVTQEENVKPYASQLQYYLVISLVFITIVILALLVLMLLARNKWTAEKTQINSDDLFNQHDEHIASINARIHENLKRYDEV
jgi:hypothetical protein